MDKASLVRLIVAVLTGLNTVLTVLGKPVISDDLINSMLIIYLESKRDQVGGPIYEKKQPNKKKMASFIILWLNFGRIPVMKSV